MEPPTPSVPTTRRTLWKKKGGIIGIAPRVFRNLKRRCRFWSRPRLKKEPRFKPFNGFAAEIPPGFFVFLEKENWKQGTTRTWFSLILRTRNRSMSPRFLREAAGRPMREND